MWTALIKRVQISKRKFASDEKLKAQIDELVNVMIFTRIEIKAAGLFNIDLSVITSVSVIVIFLFIPTFSIQSTDCLVDRYVFGGSCSV